MSHNFCPIWSKFKKFKLVDFYGDITTKCPNWKWVFSIDNFDYLRFRNIPIDKERETEKETNERVTFNNRIKSKIEQISKLSNVDLEARYNCMICTELIDFKNNLQWNNCQKIYWFHCLIQWISSNSTTCPNWRNEINSNKVFVNNGIENEIDFIISTIGNQHALRCKYHHEVCELFCKDWNIEVWQFWVEKKKHNQHQLSPILEIKNEILKNAKSVTDDDSKLSTIIGKETEIINRNQELVTYRIDCLFNDYIEKIYSIKQKIMEKIDSAWEDAYNKINSKIEETEENELILSEFIKSKKDIDIFKNLEAIDRLKILNYETRESINKMNNSLENPEMFLSLNPKKLRFSIDRNLFVSPVLCEIKLEHKSNKSEDSSFKRFKIGDNQIQMSFDETQKNNYYSKVEMKKNNVCRLKERKITKIWSDSQFYNLNEFFLLSKDEEEDESEESEDKDNDENGNIELKIILWNITNHLSRFIDSSKATINQHLIKFIESKQAN